MTSANDTAKELLTLRVSPKLREEARAIARREGETTSMVLRRLLRRGLKVGRQTTNDNEAA